ncbi:MAG: DUF4082 domain-containing protein [Chloroflexi bacterium]|nr:DUF4082 domain-containing protein [Chloroflexota bacterium]
MNDNQAIELGMRFRTTIPGEVTALRFFKAPSALGEMVASLWTEAGALLASGSISAIADSGGWREVVLPTPVPLTVGTNYVVSYFSPAPGWFVISPEGAFATDLLVGPLVAPANVVGALNGVYRYDGGFPNAGGGRNYYVDVVVRETLPPDTTPPTVISTSPAANATGVGVNASVTATFSEAIDPATLTASTFELRDPGNALVAAAVSYSAGSRTATLDPDAALANNTTYQAMLKGGTGGIADLAGNPLAGDLTWSFTTAAPPPPPPDEGPGGPILVIATATDPFGRYYAEILRAEGLNAFTVTDITLVDTAVLANYDVVILAHMGLTPEQVTLFSDWVTAGGNLIAMRPDAQLAGLLGLAPVGATTLAEGYLLMNTAAAPGVGIVGETIQFHGTADLYSLDGATAVATLYSNASTATSNPAVTLASVGANGGQAAAFTYDLAKSVVYTRQGNPAWAGDERDGFPPVRSNDMFYGAKTGDVQPDWIDLNKVQIPQADEQQRLLANLILHMNLDETPLPRFWYFPRGEKAVVVMTGDDHASTNGTATHFDWFASQDPAGCEVDNWECIRSTSYIYPETPLSPSAAAAYEAQGFEVSIHVNTGCQADWTPATLPIFFAAQLMTFDSNFPTVPAPSTHRTHCIAWSDWATQPQVELDFGIRLDANYYYWPESWVQNRPGYFTGSGMPMRFADLDGTMIDVYQAATQMPDESGINYQLHTATLLDNALGAPGYYGVLTTNMHTDRDLAPAQTIVAVAKDRGVPVISARQMLTWLDGRNGSAFESLNWTANTLSFSTSIGAGANGLQVMVPAQTAGGTVSSITIAGSPVSYSLQTIKGIQYAIFDASAGTVDVSYAEDTTPPVVSSVSPPDTAVQVPTGSVVTVTFNEPMNAATVNTNTFELRAPGNVLVAAAVTYNAATNTASLTPNAALAQDTTYLATVKGGVSGVADVSGNPLAADTTWSFTTAADSCPCSIWDNSPSVGGNPADSASYELGVKFRSSEDGFITALRFYKYPENTGTHVGRLWDMSGSLLGSATFTNETASGWQEVTLDPPVAITANTVYIASYGTENGNYAFSANYFTSQGVDNGPLRALSASESPTPGTNGVLNETPGLFPNESFNDANYWVDAVFATALANDTTPPVISNISATPAANGTAVITWNTNEPATSLVGYGTTSGALNLSQSSAASVTSHSILLTGLAANTTYYYKVTSVDAANNSATSTEYSFITPAQVLTDTSPADFGAAAANSSCYIAEMEDGEVILPPTVGEEFDGTTLPVGWSSTSWTGGASTLSGGQVSVDGALAGWDAFYTPGRALEFEATFGNETFQNIGFGQSLANQTGEYWAMFGTYNTTSGLYARTNNNGAVTDTLIAGNWLGTPHRYRIEWTASQVLFTIDGSLVHTADVAILNTMRPLISDYQAGGASVNVNWLHMSPYSSPCSLTSRVFDAGETVIWDTMSWSSVVPAGASLGMSYRIGNSPTPDGSWSAFASVGSSPASLSGSSRYIQYKADLANTDNSQTPVLQNVSFASHIGADTTPPTITGRSPVPDATAVAWDTAVTATFSEAMNAATLTDTTFTLRASGAGSDMPAVVTYANGVVTLTPTANLQGGTLYLVTVSGTVTDLAGNPLGDDDTWSFTTTAQGSLTDTTVANFSAGIAGACVIDPTIGDGALRLPALIDEDFSGDSLPAGWSVRDWQDTGPGTVTFSNEQMVINGARARVDALLFPGASIEFRATFGAQPFQHIGFGGGDDTYNTYPMTAFSTAGSDPVSQLYARTWPEGGGSFIDVPLGSQWLNSPHTYHMNWYDDRIEFYIDGSLVHTQNTAISVPLRFAASDYRQPATALTVDRVRLGPPYLSPCVFESRVFDAQVVVDWLSAEWLGTMPAGTAVTVETRTGSSATLESEWSEWLEVDALGNMDNPDGRYAQYRLTLSTTDVNATPIIEEVTLRYSVDIIEIAQFTGFVDLQGRANDSGAVVEVFDIANKASSTLLASGASAAGGGYTTAFHGTRQLEVGTSYYLQINRPLFLPTTILVADDWQHWANLVERPLTALNTVVLLGGDATNSSDIGIGDAACIGGAFGSTTPGKCSLPGEPGYDPASTPDVNGDGAVNILDLTLMGGNYGRSFSPWTPQ